MSDEPNIEVAQTEESTSSSLMTEEETTSESEADASETEESGNGESSSESEEATGDGSNNTPPETYADFELPEGIEADSMALEAATPLFKELGLTQDNAQKLVNFYAEQVKAGEQRQIDAFDQLIDGWRKDATSDKEFGGDKFNESISIARQAMQQLGTPELTQLMDEHGVGNHPEVIRFMYRVGLQLKPDVPGGNGQPMTKQEDDIVSTMYPQKSA